MSEFPPWLMLISPILSLQIGLFVFFADRRAALNRIFLAVSLMITLWNLENAWMTLSISPKVISALRIGAIFLPATTLHLVVTYSGRNDRITKSLVYFSYLIAITITATTDGPFLGTPLPVHILTKRFIGLPVPQLPFALYTVYFLIAVCYEQYFLWQKFVRTTSPQERRQIVLVGASSLLAIFSGTLGILYHAGFLFHRVNNIATFSYLAAMAWAIGRYRFGNTTSFFRTSAIYSLVLASVVGFYVAIVVALGRWANASWGWSPFLLALMVTLAVGPLFYPVKQWTERLVGRFFPQTRDVYFEGLVSFSKELNFVLPLPQLADFITLRLAQLLDLEVAALLVCPEQISPFAQVIELVDPESRDYRSRRVDVTVSALPQDAESLGERLGLPIAEVVPLESRGMRVGLLGLGTHRHGEALSSEDWGVVNALAGQAGIALENAELYSRLVDLKNHYLAVIESTINGILAVNEQLVITDVNAAAGKILGLRQDLINKSLYQIPEASRLIDLVQSVYAAGSAVRGYELPMHGPSESDAPYADTPYAVNISRLRERPDAEPRGALIVFSDLTNIKAMERQMDRAERLGALGHLAAGLAHEIRNGLNKIGGYAIMLEDKLGPESEFRRLTTGIQEDVAALEDSLSRFLSFARSGKTRDDVVSLGDLARRVGSALNPRLEGQGVTLRISGRVGGGVIRGDALRLEQAMLNLILNAAEAMEGGGEIRVQVAEKRNQVVVSVQDNGPGIPAANREAIFNPFFTTKPRGTGLGLPITHRIVSEHGGTLELETTVERGAKFVMAFPRPA